LADIEYDTRRISCPYRAARLLYFPERHREVSTFLRCGPMNRRPGWIKIFLMRNKVTLQDLTLLAVTGLVTAYVLLQVDVFVKPGAIPLDNTIEPDELPILGMALSLALLVIAWRRLRLQKRETAARLEAQAKLSQMAFQDALTGLPNRRGLLDHLSVTVSSPPAAGNVHALIMLDLNGFKRINDVFGHGAGDQTLIVVGQRLLAAVRDGDMVARLGGDEFAIIATQLTGGESATSLGLRILDGLSQPISTGHAVHQIGAGIGICLLPFEGATADEALRRADVALYRAKAARKPALHFFDEGMDQQVRERNTLEYEFRLALDRHDIEPYFQPLVDLNTNAILGFEALARWTHASMGPIAPERFIAIAEDTGLISQLTDQLLRAACKAACNWPGQIFLSFNISAAELRGAELAPRILAILAETGFSPRRLEIEITESALVRDMPAARDALTSLREAGVSLALDDFGTGYSSLYHLRNFKVDKIKIDRSFIHNMSTELESGEIVAALVGLARGLGLEVTAEGIENEAEEDRLIGLGCRQGQGFLFSAAVSAHDAAALCVNAGTETVVGTIATHHR
jgi:diguanylate cyclase (GGDEF)-like protein